MAWKGLVPGEANYLALRCVGGLQKESPDGVRASESVEAEGGDPLMRGFTLYLKIVLTFVGTVVARLTVRRGR
jgi:hypothetical protein